MKFRIGRNDFLKALSQTGPFDGFRQWNTVLKTGDGMLNIEVFYDKSFSVSTSVNAETDGEDKISTGLRALRCFAKLAGSDEHLTLETDEKESTAIMTSKISKAVLAMNRPFHDCGGENNPATWKAVFEAGSFAKALSTCLIRPIRYDTFPVKVARCGSGAYAMGTNGLMISRIPVRTIEADDGMGFNIPCYIIPALVSFLEGKDTVEVTDSGRGISVRGRNSTFRFEINGCKDFPDIGRYFDKDRYSPSNPDICAINLPQERLMELVETMTGPDGKEASIITFRMENKVLTISTLSLPGIRTFLTYTCYTCAGKAPDFTLLLRSSYLQTVLKRFDNHICTFVFRPNENDEKCVQDPLVILSDGDWESDDGVHVMAVLCR